MYEFINTLSRLPYIEEIWLFGSRARGDHRSRSDIDIAILGPTITLLQWSTIVDILENVDSLLKIDCVQFDLLACSDKLRQNIVDYHIVLYQRGKNYMHKLVWKDYFDTLGEAINRLEEVLTHKDIHEIEYLQDATIQRFEFSVELYWKVLRKFLAYEQIEAFTPREVLRNSYQYGLIDDEQVWIAMLNDRNKTSHVYKKEDAQRIFQHIASYFPVMKGTYVKLTERFNKM